MRALYIEHTAACTTGGEMLARGYMILFKYMNYTTKCTS